jgi:26S proteasome regulatory subunit N6
MADQAAAMDIDNNVETTNETEDEFQHKLEQIDTSDGLSSAKIGDYLTLLQNSRSDEAAIKIKEQCIYRLAKIYTEQNQFTEVANLLKGNGEFFGAIPKARTAKIVRNMLNIVATVPDSLSIQIDLCQDVIAWCKLEKRSFLRQRIEAKLAALLLQQKQPMRAMTIIDDLLTELRRLDDKQMLTEVHLIESRVYHALQNIPKSKASLTACRTAANAIYVAPLLQAEIDEMSGILHCEETDYTTSYSYFLEVRTFNSNSSIESIW